MSSSTYGGDVCISSYPSCLFPSPPKETKNPFPACSFPLTFHSLEKESIIFADRLGAGVVSAQLLLEDRQGSLQQRLRFGVLPLGLIEESKIVETDRCVGMAGSQLLLADRQGSLVQRLRFRVPPLCIV